MKSSSKEKQRKETHFEGYGDVGPEFRVEMVLPPLKQHRSMI